MSSGPVPTSGSSSLYEAHQKLYPREVDGRFQRLRHLAVWVLLGLFYLLPWISWGGRQSVLFDLPGRKFHVFGMVFWPQDFIYLTWLLVMAGLLLFFVTSVAGRLWCGFACPQTVWTEVFLWVERRVEGDRNRRMKLDRAPWTFDKLWRKGTKHFFWLLLALWTGFTFVGFFTPVQQLSFKVMNLATGPWETFWILFYGFATWGNAGVMREQVCKYMCPYARFQSAMFDRDTLVIAYDAKRGEPRGARRRSAEPSVQGLGDCIDCLACVQVCPTGIDIREGLQYECIACAACVDACDSIMDRMQYPRGLIRYSSDHAMQGEKTRAIRLRTLVYGGLITLLAMGFVGSISLRTPLGLDVMRDRNALYRELPDGSVENVYTLRILNKGNDPGSFELALSAPAGMVLDTDRKVHEVGAGEVYTTAARVRAAAGAIHGGHDIEISVSSVSDPALRASHTARFIAP